MKCPLFHSEFIRMRAPELEQSDDCLKEECAVWSTEMDQCDPTGLLPWFVKLVALLEDILDKLPHEEQLRK